MNITYLSTVAVFFYLLFTAGEHYLGTTLLILYADMEIDIIQGLDCSGLKKIIFPTFLKNSFLHLSLNLNYFLVLSFAFYLQLMIRIKQCNPSCNVYFLSLFLPIFLFALQEQWLQQVFSQTVHFKNTLSLEYYFWPDKIFLVAEPKCLGSAICNFYSKKIFTKKKCGYLTNFPLKIRKTSLYGSEVNTNSYS